MLKRILLVSICVAPSVLVAAEQSSGEMSAPMHLIPVVENPEFIQAAAAGFPQHDELVLVVALRGQARAYTIRFLGRYEVINDWVADAAIFATW